MKVFLWIWRGIWPIIGIAAIGYWGGKMSGEISGGMSVGATVILGAVCSVVGLIVGFTGWAEEVPPRWFWTMSNFTIADHFGTAAVQETYNRAFNEWKNNIEYLTELVLVLNHKIWQHYDHNIELERVYDRLWREVDGWCVENLTG